MDNVSAIMNVYNTEHVGMINYQRAIRLGISESQGWWITNRRIFSVDKTHKSEHGKAFLSE